MIVLDTNVLSEVFKPDPDLRVVAWLGSLTGPVSVTAVAVAELLAGVRRMPDGRRKVALTQAIAGALEPYRRSDAVLPFDDHAAAQYAEVLFDREHAGLPIHTADAQIAAICRVHRATCATRNVRDFVHTGIDVFSPWEE